MIPSFPNVERAKRSFRLVKIWGNIFGGVFSVALFALTPLYVLFPNIADVCVGIAMLTGFISYLGFAISIATLAQDLGRSYFAWILGAFLAPPVGLIVAYYRVKYIAMENGVYGSQQTSKKLQVEDGMVLESKESRNPIPIPQKQRGAMNDNVKIALIVAVTIIICVGLWIYFSPYHSCVRSGDPNFLCAGGSWGSR